MSSPLSAELLLNYYSRIISNSCNSINRILNINMDSSLTNVYLKKRKDFGRQPLFCEVNATLLDSINPDKCEQKLYCCRNPVNRETQTSTILSEHCVNTIKITTHNQGVEHAEGGWSKDININDDEATSRYRKRIERDDPYISAIMSTYPKFTHYINQNNAIEMYNTYFKEMESKKSVEKYSFCMNKAATDENKRPIAAICWTCEDDSKLVAAYCDKKFPISGHVNTNLKCFVWDIEYPNEPSDYFDPPSACWQVVCSPKQHKVIIGGLEDGRVSIFDIREQSRATVLSPMHLSHRDPVSALMYIPSRLNTEFFSGSSDGKCMWWDIRNISQPTNELIMSVRVPTNEKVGLTNSEGVSALQCDRNFPTKFLCGTDTGLVINVNRKGKSHHEIMSKVFDAHNGPVRAVHRSPCSSKIFITCGDWTAHIWSDDIQSVPIIRGSAQRKQISDIVWSPRRVSGYMSVSYDGKFRYWDLLRKRHAPVLVLPVSDYPLTKLKPNEKNHLVAVGDTKGSLNVISLSQNLIWSEERDKQLMIQCFEREYRREHILATKVKEIRLKIKAEEEAAAEPDLPESTEENLIINTKHEYFKMVTEELRKYDAITNWSKNRLDKMRKR